MNKTILLSSFVVSTTVAIASDFAVDILTNQPRVIRVLAADRPDSTESPVTVDKGMWQIEASVLDYARNNSGGIKTETWTWAETNLKYGVSDNVDFQIIFSPYIFERSKTAGVVTDEEDASDVTLRIKWNLWGNDGGKTAFALFPYVKIPTKTAHSNGEWEGGLIIPFSVEVNDRMGLGLQVEVAYVRDDVDGDYDIDLLHTAVLGYSVCEEFGVYVEYLGIMNSDSNPYESYASGGVTYTVTETFQLDIGAVYGLNAAADDLNVFTGFTTKF